MNLDQTFIFSNSKSLAMTDAPKSLCVLAIGDPHFKINNVEHSCEFVDKTLVFIDDNPQIDLIIVLGDVHDKHQYTHIAISSHVSKFFQELHNRKPVYLVVGNHDRQNNSDFLSDIHPFNDMKLWPNMTVVDHVIETNIKGHKLVFVPYVPPGRFEEALNTIQNPLENTAVIFAHQEFYGAPMGAIKSVVGDKWPIHYPYVISGHIHDYWFNGKNIIYVGTPMQHAFGDRQDKTLSLYQIDGEYDICGVSVPPPETNEEMVNVNGKLIGNDFLSEYIVEYKRYKVLETRIDLHMKKREIIRVSVDRIHEFRPNPAKLQKLIIVGTKGQIQALQKWFGLENLKKTVAKVDYDYIEDTTDLQQALDNEIPTEDNVSYMESLYAQVESKPLHLKILHELFGSLTQTSGSLTQTSAVTIKINV